ncbi:OLC1v1037484C1 [Oldenlandia corymbosa var. corymbosa]|uniref:OLC1v1037484C1 n=1 Tax=Oldenlandia corymbosa var. corymbosa TaxID=529605 RepID=A0AAV1E4Z7_OLDCO|nr:OLC1v1037484C1 [Oldenlandia corymbosa var. corymbosa]
MKSTTTTVAGGHHHQRRAEVGGNYKEEADPVIRREKKITSTDNGQHQGIVGGKKVEEPNKNKALERKSTEDINQSAEAFINKFRQQLLLQRLESIENYEQMLRRGT